MAKSLTPPASPLIGVRLPSWATFLRGIYPGLLEHLHEHAMWRLQTTEDTTHEIPPVVIDENFRGDGLIVFRCTRVEVDAWLARGIRVVSISTETPDLGPGKALPTVVPDNQMIGRLAAEHLLARGLRAFAYWLDPTRVYACQRRDGFVDTLRRAGHDAEILGIPVSTLPRAERWHAIESAIRSQLRHAQGALGVFAKDDISAAAIVRCCQNMGLRVPEDVAVIGCNNDPAFVFTTMPGLTSVTYPGREVGAAAARMLDRMLRSADWLPVGPELIPPGEVVERRSTAVFGFEDPLVRRVWAWLYHHSMDRPVKVAELASELAVAEPTLRRRFRHSTGRTVKATIDEHRMRRIQAELTNGNTSIKRVAYRFGFASPEELSRFVKRCTGETPSRWRERG